MAITIKHLEGPLADSKQHFGDEVTTIVFGRDPDSSQVLYPPEFTTVARRHFALKLTPSGNYVIEPHGDGLVTLDGQPAEAGAEIVSGSIIAFGRGEALFEVEISYRSSYSVGPPARPIGAGSGSPPAGSASPDSRPAASDPVGARLAIRRAASTTPQGVPADLAGVSVEMEPSPESFPHPVESRAPMSARRRSRAALWWLLAAIALGVLCYFLLRRDTALGEVIGGAIPAVMS